MSKSTLKGERPRVQSRTSGPSKTQQHKAADADINNIVNRHMRNAQPGQRIGNPQATRQPRFIDVSAVDFQQMLDKVCDMQNQFAGLPSRIRGKFRNDPYQMLRFVDNPNNRDEALRLGLITPTEEELVRHHERQADYAANRAGELAKPLKKEEAPIKADDEANPRYTPPKGGKTA